MVVSKAAQALRTVSARTPCKGCGSCDFRKKHIHLVTDGNGKRPHYQVRSAEFQCGERFMMATPRP